ncbi:hypothetical protein R50073_15170 [Maricurvus nonylphenolicus]|uniref:SurA N-terminal domain-containing protein n=1 Tax=Maricurvus nonylphenolicus TaxID=1008307 RepID=UPI0036F31C0D
MVNKQMYFLLACVFVGAAAAIWQSDRLESATVLASDTVAQVNGHPIRLVDYSRTLDAIADDRREELSDIDRQFVLRRLIEEELLVQEAIQLDMITDKRNVRRLVAEVMLDSIVANLDVVEPTDKEIEETYQRVISRDGMSVGDKAKLDQLRPALIALIKQEHQSRELNDYTAWMRRQANLQYHTSEVN